MKVVLIAALVIGAVAARASSDEALTPFWSDEFNYSGHPDPSKWGYEKGWIRNREKQFYTENRLENARVENGVLVLEGRREDFFATKSRPAQYTSASLFAKVPAGFLYGRLEVRAKLPAGNGVWPAIWTLGDDMPRVGWPACGEIDMMEFVGKEPQNIYSTLHYQSAGAHKMNQKRLHAPSPSDAFHVYAMEWYPDRIDFSFDGEKYQSAKTDDAGIGDDNPFRKPQRLLINLALGGAWGGEIDDKALPQKFLIDYVRIFKGHAVSP